MTRKERRKARLMQAALLGHDYLDRIEALLRERADVAELLALGQAIEALTRTQRALLARLEIEHAIHFSEQPNGADHGP